MYTCRCAARRLLLSALIAGGCDGDAADVPGGSAAGAGTTAGANGGNTQSTMGGTGATAGTATGTAGGNTAGASTAGSSMGDGGATTGDAIREAGTWESGALDVPSGCKAGNTTAVDLLFVIDNSFSMHDEQVALARELPRMVRAFVSGDTDGDGEPDTLPVESLHLGAVTTDMGAVGYDRGSCAGYGDDGVLRIPESCGGESESGFLSFAPGDEVDAVGDQFACIAQVGTSGCGLEQQLDAMLKALIDDPEVLFFEGSTGHGGPAGGATANAGFLRDNALLGVVLVTDEDDCSVPDDNAELMSHSSSGAVSFTNTATGEPFDFDLSAGINVRCGAAPEALHPIDRYVDGLLALKPDHPERVIFSAITGVPPDLENVSPEKVLADPRMDFVPEPELSDGNATPRASCERSDPSDSGTRGQGATPPRRIVELAGRFGDAGVLRSICREDFSGAIDAILEKISRSITCVTLI